MSRCRMEIEKSRGQRCGIKAEKSRQWISLLSIRSIGLGPIFGGGIPTCMREENSSRVVESCISRQGQKSRRIYNPKDYLGSSTRIMWAPLLTGTGRPFSGESLR